MRGKQALFLSLFIIVIVAVAGVPTKTQYYEISAQGNTGLIAGRNVNMVSGMSLPDGDPYLQRQNEPSIAVSTRNPLHLLAGANDYRTVDVPFEDGELPNQMQNQAQGDAWLSVFKSLDGGQSWKSTLLDGYPQQNNVNSPLNGYDAAADPVVRAGANGLFFYSGIVFDRVITAHNAVFVARFIDNNNDEEGDPVQHIDTTIIDELNGNRFKDKPWIAVSVPKKNAKTINIDGQNIPRYNVYVVYSVFKELEGTQQSEILFCRSTDCGNTWEDPIVLSSGHYLNQGATIAVDPRDNAHVFVAWRRFDSSAGGPAQSDAIVIARSTNEGKEFPDVVEVAEVPGAFDQPTSSVIGPLSGTAFRTNSYPTMTIDSKGRVYLAWSQRGLDALYPNDSRVVIATSKDGLVWTTPMEVESAIVSANGSDCYGFMPTIAFAGGRLILAWYDTRNDYCPQISPEWICDSDPIRHTIDVRVAIGQTGAFPTFQPSVQVSRYLWAMEDAGGGNYFFRQVQFNPPNYPLFKGGTVPFHGDYIEIAPSPSMVLDSKGVWRFNTEPTDSQHFHLAWTDNRDVRPPVDGLSWTIYNPPSSSGSLNQSQFTINTQCSVPANTGMRNQNVYTSLITSVMEAGSPGNNKPLGTLGTNPTTGDLIPRAFVIFVKNLTEDIRYYRLQITDSPDRGTASFLEFDMLETIDVSIAPYSSISRPLFVTSSDKNDIATVEVFEIDEIGGNAVQGGVRSTIVINPDATNPQISGDLANKETHNPDIANPNIVNWTYVNPNIVNPNIVNDALNPNIVNPNIVNPNIVNDPLNPNIVNPNIVNPNIVNWNYENPNIVNPNIVNPNIVNSSIADADVTDIEWPVMNVGNTVSSYTFKIFARESLPRGIYAQLLVYKVHYAPATDGVSCELQQTPHHELLLNIVNPNIVNPNIVNPNIVNPNIVNSAIENATFFLSPGEEAKAVLRLIDPDPGIAKFLQSGRKFKIQSFAESLDAATGSQAVDSEDAQQGDTTGEADSTELIVITSGLPDGTVGDPYPTIQLEAAGGDGTYVWYANSELLPPGIGITNDGIISGIPQEDMDVTYPHVYSFIVQVSSGGEVDTQNLSITINSAEEPTPPLNIQTTNLPPGTWGNYYGYTLQATGGKPPRNWSKESGTLPLGLTLDNAGVISGTIAFDPELTYPHTYNFIVKVTDATMASVTQSLSITVDEIEYEDLTISGTITGQGGLPISEVAIYGLPRAPKTDSYGFYSDTVPYSWSGTITPFKAGYTFRVSAQDPSPSRTYAQITADQLSQDFVANTINYTVSGTVTFYGSPLGGVTMNGLPGTPVTDANGYYSAPVPHGWSGTVTPELLDYVFEPPSRTYTSITSDHVLQNYVAFYVGVGQDDPFEENDDFASASRVTAGTITNLQLYDDDWYRVSIGEGEDLGISVDGDIVNDIDVEICDSSGNRIAGAYGSPPDETAYASDLSSGWYYIHVAYLGDSGFWNSYSLTVTTGDITVYGNITGRVTNPSMNGIPGVEIWSYDTQSEHYFITTTDTNGDYRISLPPSVYKLKFDASKVTQENYVSEFYDSKYTYEDADEVLLQAGDLIGGVDAQLEEGTVLAITTTSLPNGNVANPYSVALEAFGGQTPYSWSFAAGSGPLPNGLILHETGLIDGIPTTTGTFDFTIQVTDSSLPTSQTDERAFSIIIGSPDNYPQGMISYWKFDEEVGPNAFDSFDANHGTITGAAWTQGQVNGALSFDGVDDYVSVGDFAGYSNNVSVEAWIKTPASGGVDNWDDIICGPVGDIIFGISGNRLNFAGQGATPIDHNTWSTTLLNDNEWHHVAGTYDGSQVCVYVDGQQEACNPANGSFTPGFKHIGRGDGDGEHFNGLIDEVAIYNRALLPLEIEQHYLNGLNGLGYEVPEGDLVITTTFLPDGNVAMAYVAQLEAMGGTEPYSWSLAAGSNPLPDGLTLNSSGVIEGTPTTLGTFNFTVEVTDESSPLSQTATQPLSITINAYAGSDNIISGSVTPPLSGVVLSGFPGNPATDGSGNYTVYVYSGWSGTVTPILSGYSFEPASRTYNNLTEDISGENYSASAGVVISGQVTLDGSPLEGVVMSGLPSNPLTDENGQYSGAVSSGLNVTVTPTAPGFSFDPPSRTYSGVTQDQTGQNYTTTYQGGQDDAYEDNNDLASAAELTLGTHTNLVLNDVDWFKIHIPAGNEGKDLKINLKGLSYPQPNGYEDLDLIAVDDQEKMLGYTLSSSGDETLYLTDIQEGWYYFGQTYISQPGTVYSLTVELSDNFGIGYIFGRVTDEITGQPIQGVYVELYGQPFDWANPRPLITTNSNGEYKVGFIPGNYTVNFNNYTFNFPYALDVNYIAKTYKSNEILNIVAGSAIEGVDDQLRPGGTINGRITGPDGNGLANGIAFVYARNTTQVSYSWTDGNGNYSIKRVPTGNFKIRARAGIEGSIWYDGMGSFESGHPVPVKEGMTTPGIDLQLEDSAIIEGRVIDNSQNPIQGVIVTAYDMSGITLWSGQTNEDGYYWIGSRIPTGDVKIEFDARGAGGNYASEYYTDKLLIEDADPVSVQSGQTISNIDAVLVEGGRISGRVTNAQDNGFPGVTVHCFDVDSDRVYGATTDANGYYTIGGLQPDDYKVRFRTTYGDYATRWFGGTSFANGSVISVSAGANLSGIDAQLLDNGGFISGRVTNTSGGGIQNVRVIAQDSIKEAAIAWADTDSEGYYTIPRIPTCDAKIYFNTNSQFLNYVSEWYNDSPSHASADTVAVTENQETANINAVLASIPPVNIVTTSLSNGEVATPYEAILEVTGGREFYHWSLISGTLPPGLMLNSKGEIAGTPTAAGTHNFTVRVTDSSRNQQLIDTQTLNITIDAYSGAGYLVSGEILFDNFPLGGVVLQGLPGNPMTGSNGEYIVAVPQGWSGTVTPTSSGYFFDPPNRNYSNVDSNQSNQDFTAYELTLNIATVWLLNGTEGHPYSQTLSAEGGTEPYTWSLAPGSSPLPYGLTLASDGTISGAPTQPNNYDFTVRVTDSSSPVSQYVEKDLSIFIHGDPTSESPVLYWKLDEGDGTIAMDSSGRNVYGTLMGNVSYTSDSVSGYAAEILADGWLENANQGPFHFVNQATIMARVKIDDFDQQNRFVWKLQYDEPYRGHPYSIEIKLDINGSMLHLDSGNGLIQNILNCPHFQIDVDLNSTGFALGQYNQIAVTINGDVYRVFINGNEVATATGAMFEVHDSVQCFWVGGASWSEYWLGGKVDEVMVFNMAYEPQQINEIYSMGVLPTISGTVRLSDGSPLPWVRMEGLSGDPQVQEDGTYIGIVPPGWSGSVTPEMGGYYFNPASRSYNDVTSDFTGQDYTAYGQGSLWIETGSLPNGTKNQSYSATLVAADGVPPYTWDVVSGSLPLGLSLNPSGVISGEPTEGGDFTFTVRVVDSDSPPRAAELPLTLFISAAHQGFWNTSYPGGGEIYREGLAIDPNPGLPDRIFATAGGRGIFKSEDGGANWANLIDNPNWPYGESDYPIFWTHPGLGNFYMSTWGHLYMSADGGDNWQQIYSRDNWDMISFAVDPFGSDVIYVGTQEEGIFKTVDGGQYWSASSSGLPSDEIRVIAIDPNDLSAVYVGTRDNGIFKTIDGGGSWTSVNNNMDFQWISDIVIRNDSHVYVAGSDSENGEGIFRSINGGGTWTKLPMNHGVDWSPGNYIAVDPSNSDIIYFVSFQSVLKSIDGGDSWTDSSTSPSPNTLLHLHFDGDFTGVDGEVPTQASGVTFEDGIFGSGAYFADANEVFYQSADNIDSTEGTLEFWIKPRWNGNDGLGHTMILFGGEGGMTFTKDGANNLRSILNLFGGGGNPEVGAIVNVEDWIAHEWHHCAFTWTNDSVKLYIDGVLRAEESVTFPLPVVSEPTFQMGANGIYDYLDAVIDELRISSVERSPQEIADSYTAGLMQNLNITSIVIDPQNPQTLYIGTQGEGVFKSENGGVSWTRVSNGINALHFVGDSPHGLEIDKSDPDYIYAGSINGGYRSTNGGSSWAKMNYPSGSVLALLTHPNAAGKVYAFHNDLRISTSNGSPGSWDIAAGFPEWAFSRGDIGIAADDPDIIYVGTWGSDDPPTGVYKTTDGGLNFTLMNNGLTTNTEIQTVTVHPEDHDIAFIGLRRQWPYEPGTDYGLYKTIDGGNYWDKITCGLPDDIFARQIVFSPSDPDIMYIVGETDYECGVYKSVDGGQCWFKISWPCGNALAISPDNSDLLYLGAWNAFFVSLNAGNDWVEFNDGLPRNPGIDTIALDPNDPKHVFIGTASGVYEATFIFDFMITTDSLPTGVVGEPYSAFIEVSGGTPGYSWELVSGDLPEGLTFNETTGEISGMPEGPDYRQITIKATDNDGNSYSKQYDLNVSNKYFLTWDTNPPGVGSVSIDPDEPWYIQGAQVDASVNVPGGYVFTGWGGDATGKATLVHIEMIRDKNLIANFASPETLPDYDFSAFEAPGTASAGDTIAGPVNAEVRNQGAPDAYTGDISVGIYLSPNPQITTSDMLLWKGRTSISALSGGTASVPIPADLQIPTTVSPGVYSIGILVDEFDVVAEQNEDNNFASLEITITSTPYDHLAYQGQWHGGESNAVACDELRNLAFVGNGALFQVLDVSDPSHPIKIGEIALGQKGISDIKISGNTAYVAGDGFRIVDVSIPTSPNEIGHNDNPNLARGVVVSGNYAYVTDHFHMGLRVFNISDLSNPNQTSFTPFPGRTRGIAKSGNYLYIQAGVWLEEGETGLRIVNVSNPSSPSQVGFYSTEGEIGWPEIAGNYLFLPTASEGLHILDISDPLHLPEAIVYSGWGNSGWVKAVGNHLYASDVNRNAVVVLNIADVNNVYEEGVYYFQNPTSVNCMDVLGNYCYADGWYNALKILDMSNPSNPTKVGSYDFEGLLRDVDVSEDFAYMTTYNERGVARFRTLDISSLPQIAEVGVLNYFNDMYRVRVSGNYAYVVNDNRELKVLDISDPSNPHEVAAYGDFDNIYDLEVSGNYAYVLDYYRGLQVIDISSPAHPVFVSQWYTNPRSIRLAISGNYAYVSALWAGVRIIDISDPMNPWEIGFYQAEDFRAYELEVSGNYVYVEDVDYNMRIIDVSDLQNPVEVGKFITDALDISDIEVSGHVVFLGSYVRGMMVIDVADPANPVKLDEFPAFYTRAIAIRENRIYELVRGAGLIVYEYRRQ